MRRFIAPALPGETSEEEDVYELTHIDHLFIRDRIEIPGFGNYETLKSLKKPQMTWTLS